MKMVKMSHLEITEVVLVHGNVVSNNYQQDSSVLYTFVLSKSFDVLPENFIFLKIFNPDFSYINVWFTNQNLDKR